MWKTNEFPTSLTNARIYGCLCSAEKLRPVSPTHNNEEMDVPLGSQPKKELTSPRLFLYYSYEFCAIP